MIKNLHHVGIVVKDLEKTITLYGGMLGGEPVSHIQMKEAHLNLASFKLGGSMLEFLEGSPGSPFEAFLEKNGEGIHHIAYEVDDIEGELQKLEALGVKLEDKEPRDGPGSRIAFVGPEGAGGVYIELVEPLK